MCSFTILILRNSFKAFIAAASIKEIAGTNLIHKCIIVTNTGHTQTRHNLFCDSVLAIMRTSFYTTIQIYRYG